MKRLYRIGFPVLMLFDTIHQFAFKFTGQHALPMEFSAAWVLRVLSQPWLYVAIAAYAGAFLTWMRLLRDAPVGPAFAASHLEVVSVLLISAVWLHERLGVMQWLGALAIVAGILCLARAESDDPHAGD